MSKLYEKKKLLRLKSQHLINDCVTIWGSTYRMLNWFTEQQQAICEVLLESSSSDDRHLIPVISVGEEFTMVLNVFHDVPEIIIGEKYPTIEIVTLLLKKLEITSSTKEDNSTLVKQIKGVIQRILGNAIGVKTSAIC